MTVVPKPNLIGGAKRTLALTCLIGIAAACTGSQETGADSVEVVGTPTIAIIEEVGTVAPAAIATTPDPTTKVVQRADIPSPPATPEATSTPVATRNPANTDPTPDTEIPSGTPVPTATATPTATAAPTATPRPQSATAADNFDPAGLAVGPGSGFIPLDEPVMIAAADATWLDDDEIVMGLVANNGETLAFPVRQMAYHHIANLTVAGEPYLVTY